MPCGAFSFEEMTPEFLGELTKVCALQVHNTTGNPDSLYNWVEGKKLVAFIIVDCYLKKCRVNNKCIPMPTHCYEYLKELSIEEAKRLKAYFMWESKGRHNGSNSSHLADYYIACDELFSFCDPLPNNHSDCTYLADILFRIDRRKVLKRRLATHPCEAHNRRMTTSDRRHSQNPHYAAVTKSRNI